MSDLPLIDERMCVRRRTLLPSAFMTYRSWLPSRASRLLENAIRSARGDHAGSMSASANFACIVRRVSIRHEDESTYVKSRPMDETWQSELSEFIAIPSVSADPAHREDVKRAGEWVCDFIRRIGGTAELTPFGKKELALGEIPASNGAGDAPTVLCYGHFDVQPPAPLDLWESDPFALTIKDEWAYARGVTDDKGQLYILLKAAQKLVEADALPVNLRFASDGEEEIGGTTIVDYLGVDDRGANAAIIFDGGMLRMDVPVFDLATRGLIAFEVKVKTGERDLHSGMYGGAALNAIHVLMRCFDAVLAGPDGLLPDRLRQGIASPAPAELNAWEALPSGAEELENQGARPLDPNAADQFYIRTLAEPSADVNGILGGKPGLRNTTLSVQASGEFTVRCVEAEFWRGWRRNDSLQSESAACKSWPAAMRLPHREPYAASQ